MKKSVLVLACLIVILLPMFGQASSEKEWPHKPIQVIIPAGPGGDTDTTSRAISESLTKILGQPVQIINMAGGSGTVAMNDVATSPADGYKLIYHHADTVLATLLQRTPVRWDDQFDIAAVTGGGSTNAIFVHKNSPYNSLEELFAAARNNPGKVSFAMETGGLVHLLVLSIEKQAGVTFNKVDLGAAAARTAALLGQQIDVLLTVYGSARGYVDSGDFKCLGILAAERNPSLPDIPTLREKGVDATYEHFYYFGFKKGTDPKIVEKFSAAVKEAAYLDPYVSALNNYNFKPNVRTGQDAVNYMMNVEEFFTPLAAILFE
jgi:tripartite-type tricarboxylate transporter receptor subunit TctC